VVQAKRFKPPPLVEVSDPPHPQRFSIQNRIAGDEPAEPHLAQTVPHHVGRPRHRKPLQRLQHQYLGLWDRIEWWSSDFRRRAAAQCFHKTIRKISKSTVAYSFSSRSSSAESSFGRSLKSQNPVCPCIISTSENHRSKGIVKPCAAPVSGGIQRFSVTIVNHRES
jgi:hypothetical protein